MCKCDYEYGGDFKNPLGFGKNPYKLWSLSIYFNTVYVGNYLYILFILIVNEWWENLIGNNVLNTCYKDTVKYWLILHFIKPIVTTMITINCCGLHKLFCCSCPKILLLSFFMLTFDILFGILSIYYCWLDLFNIYYGGNGYCNMPPPNNTNYANTNQYDYAQSSLLFILLSFIAIHFIFIWLEAFRFVEVIVFQHNKRKLKQIRNINKKSKRNKKQQQQQEQKKQEEEEREQEYESVNLEDLSKSMADNQLIDIIIPNNNNNDVDNDNDNEISIEFDINQGVNENNIDDFDVNQWIQGLFVYGINNGAQSEDIKDDNDDNNNDDDDDNNDDNLNISELHKKGVSLSAFWKATTGVVTTGFILQLTSDDFCCVCWDEFEIGNSIAKLICGHIIHKKCAIQWFQQSVTCPTCRVSLTKN